MYEKLKHGDVVMILPHPHIYDKSLFGQLAIVERLFDEQIVFDWYSAIFEVKIAGESYYFSDPSLFKIGEL